MRHPLFARVYASVAERAEEADPAEHRQELLAGCAGGWSTSAPATDSTSGTTRTRSRRSIALEPEPYLRERAQGVAAKFPVAVSVRDGLAEALPLEDASVDAAWSRSCCQRSRARRAPSPSSGASCDRPAVASGSARAPVVAPVTPHVLGRAQVV